MNTITTSRIRRLSPQFLVTDFERSIEFYTKQLGFELEFKVEDFYAGIVREGHSIHLKHGKPSSEERMNKRENNDLDIVFAVEGVDSLYEEFLHKEIEIIQPLCDRTYGREFYIADPDGYILAFLGDLENQ